jgi:1,6-anhydro-N-acetylmuramate kinase
MFLAFLRCPKGFPKQILSPLILVQAMCLWTGLQLSILIINNSMTMMGNVSVGVTYNTRKIASEGKINEKLVEIMLSEGYFVQPPPKTTGRELYHATYATEWRAKSAELTGVVMDDRDFIATLTELTAASIAASYKKFSPGRISETVIGGGGSRNSYLLKRIEFQLEKRLGYHVDVFSHEKLGLDSDAKGKLFS